MTPDGTSRIAEIRAAFETVETRDGIRHSDHALHNLEGALIDIERQGKVDRVSLRTLHRVAEQLARIERALHSDEPVPSPESITRARDEAARDMRAKCAVVGDSYNKRGTISNSTVSEVRDYCNKLLNRASAAEEAYGFALIQIIPLAAPSLRTPLSTKILALPLPSEENKH